MLKIEKRKDGRSPYYYIKGTLRFGRESVVINAESTGCVKLKDAQRVLTKRISDLTTSLENLEFKTFGYATEQLLNDPINMPSVDRQKHFEKNAKLLGDYLLKDINVNTITQLAYERYPVIRQYKGIRFSDLEMGDMKIEMSSKYHTVNTGYIVPVGRVMHYANENKWCAYLRMSKFPVLNQSDRPKHIFTMEEIKRCLETNADFQIKLLFVFLIYTGARIQEALNVKWSDIDMTKRTIRLWQNKQKKERVAPIHSTLYDWLMKINNREDYLFEWRNVKERKNTELGLIPRWDYMLEQAGVDKSKKRHACRHTWATNLSVYSNATPQDLMDIGGWKDYRSVMNYAQSNNDRVKEKINQLP